MQRERDFQTGDVERERKEEGGGWACNGRGCLRKALSQGNGSRLCLFWPPSRLK